MTTLGIDPGMDGGVAVIWPRGLAECHPMPTVKDGNKRVLDHRTFAEIADVRNAVAYVEFVHAMPNQGVTSMFSFGQGYGAILAILDVLGIKRHLVTPQKWKGHFDLIGADKEASLEVAQSLFPDTKITGRKAQRIGQADALLIAEYGRLNVSRY